MADGGGDDKETAGLKTMLRSVLLSSKGGVAAMRLEGDFYGICGAPIPYKKKGFPNLEMYLRTMPDVVRITRGQTGEKMYAAVADETTAHIQRMVANQRPSKKRSSRQKPSKFMMRRPTPTKSAWGYKPHAVSRSYSSYNRPAMPGATSKFGLNQPRFASQPSHGFVPPPKTMSRSVIPPITAPIVVQRTPVGRTPTKTVPTMQRNREPYKVPPRFQKKQETQISQAYVSTRSSHALTISAPSTTSRSVSRSPTPEDATDFKQMLSAHVRRNNVKCEYEPQKATGGYVCTLTVGGGTYGSFGIFNTASEAESRAAKQACQDLKLDIAVEPEPLPVHTEAELRHRVQQIVSRMPNGLWDTRLPRVYEDQFKEKAPANLLSYAKRWTDIVKFEDVGAPDYQGIKRKILYPVIQASVTVTQNSQPPTLMIPEAPLPSTGHILVKVFATHLVHVQCFFVQSADSEINGLMSKIKETYDARGSPHILTNAEPGTFCVAQFSNDGMFYRAQVTGSNKQGDQMHYNVNYIDFGNEETIPAQRCRRILDNLCTQPRQCLKCALHGVYPKQGGDWDQAPNEKLEEFMKEEELLLEVVEYDDDLGCMVKVYRASDKACINNILLREDLALSTPKQLQPDELVLPEAEEWQVFVSYIKSTTDIIVRLVGPEYSEKLEELEEQLATLESVTFTSEVKVGTVCVVRLENVEDEEKNWHRVQVTHIDPAAEKACVAFLDHGDTETIPISTLHPLSPELNRLPYQRIQCKLTGLEAQENNQEICDRLLREVLGKNAVANVDDRLGRISITLWNTSSEEDININESVAQDLNMEQLTPCLPEDASTTVEGYVSYITTTGTIFFQVNGPGLQKLEYVENCIKSMHEKEAGKRYQSMTRAMNTLVNHLLGASSQLFVSSPAPDQIVFAYLAELDTWYRAKIINVFPGRKVEVLFMDYGNREVLQSSYLREIPPSANHIRTLPAQAVECRLFGLPPAGGEWTAQTLDRLSMLAPPDQKRVLQVVKHHDGSLSEVEIYMHFEDANKMVTVSEILLNEEAFSPVQNDESFTDDGINEAMQNMTEDDPRVFDDRTEGSSQGEPAMSPPNSPTEPSDEPSTPPASPVSNTGGSASPQSQSQAVGLPRTPPGSDISPIQSPTPGSDIDMQTSMNTSMDSACQTDLALLTDYMASVQVSQSQPPVSNSISQSQPSAQDTVSQSQPLTQEISLPLDTSDTESSEINSVAMATHVDIATSPAYMVTSALASGDHTPTKVTNEATQICDSTSSAADIHPSDATTPVTSWSKGSPPMLPSGEGDVNHNRNKAYSEDDLMMPPPAGLPTSGDELYFTWVCDPTNFRCVNLVNRQQLQTLHLMLESYYSYEKKVPVVTDPVIGQLYAGNHGDLWYRVVVHHILTESNQVSIHFVDYGDFQVLETSDLRPLPARFRIWPFQAIKGKLAGVTSTERVWSDEARDYFSSMVLEKSLAAWIHEKDDQDFVSMTIVDTNAGDKNAFIHKRLIEKEYAVKTTDCTTPRA